MKASRKMEAIRISDKISYYPTADEPLSANVVMIEGKDYLWVYDVGNNQEIVDNLNGYDKKKIVVLSHFHPDHIANIDKIKCEEIYQGQFTFNHIKKGTVVKNELSIMDGETKIDIIPFPSSHAKGSMALQVDDTYLFVGDGTYTGKKDGKYFYNIGLLLDEIRILKTSNAKYVFQSHKEPFCCDKQDILQELEDIYNQRKDKEQYIYF